MNAVEINTFEEFLEHMRAFLMAQNMSDEVKKFGWSLYWIGLYIITGKENEDKA